MNNSDFLKGFIRRHGEIPVIITFTVVSVVAILLVAAAIDWLFYREVHSNSVYFVGFVAVVFMPFIFYAFVRLIRQLDHSEQKLRALSIMDDLTDVYNRRYFIEQAEKEFAKARRYKTVFSIMAINIDRFKEINDEYGHAGGDAVLQALANTCMNSLRASEIFARFGDGEFIFLIPESNRVDVGAFAERILSAVENTVAVGEKCEISFTVSIGIKVFDHNDNSLEALLSAADDALSEAKCRGRCIVIYDDQQQAAS